jgi:hypothetical protein
MTAQVLAAAVGAATLVAVVAGLVANYRIGRQTVGVDLDASRRWVTLRNVDPAFAAALAAGRRQDAVTPR